METATRDTSGRFKPGCSGNPAGKQPGTLNHTTRMKQWLDDPEADGRETARAAMRVDWIGIQVWETPIFRRNGRRWSSGTVSRT